MSEKSLQEIWKAKEYRCCFGCGPENDFGLKIRSFWNGKEGVCRWQAKPYHKGIQGILNGGIIATLIDCHSFWTALAAMYQSEGIPFGEGVPIKMVTGAMAVRYLKPIPVNAEVELKACITKVGGRSRVVHCSVTVAGKEYAQGEVTLVMV